MIFKFTSSYRWKFLKNRAANSMFWLCQWNHKNWADYSLLLNNKTDEWLWTVTLSFLSYHQSNWHPKSCFQDKIGEKLLDWQQERPTSGGVWTGGMSATMGCMQPATGSAQSINLPMSNLWHSDKLSHRRYLHIQEIEMSQNTDTYSDTYMLSWLALITLHVQADRNWC